MTPIKTFLEGLAASLGCSLGVIIAVIVIFVLCNCACLFFFATGVAMESFLTPTPIPTFTPGP